MPREKAGHPVTRAARFRSGPSRRTGSSAFADDDSTRYLRKQTMTEIRVPTLGESVTEATIGRWFKKAGDPVAVDEPLVEPDAPNHAREEKRAARDSSPAQIKAGRAAPAPTPPPAPAKAAAPAAPPPPA